MESFTENLGLKLLILIFRLYLLGFVAQPNLQAITLLAIFAASERDLYCISTMLNNRLSKYAQIPITSF